MRLRSRLADVALCEIVAIQAPDFRQSGSRVESELSTLSLYHDMRFDTFDLREHELPRDERETLRGAVRVLQDFGRRHPKDG